MSYKVHKFGDIRERRDFSKTANSYALTDLLEIQKKSYQEFLTEGIDEVFKDIFPVESFLRAVQPLEQVRLRIVHHGAKIYFF